MAAERRQARAPERPALWPAALSLLLHLVAGVAALSILEPAPPAMPEAERGVQLVWQEVAEDSLVTGEEAGGPPPPPEVAPPEAPPQAVAAPAAPPSPPPPALPPASPGGKLAGPPTVPASPPASAEMPVAEAGPLPPASPQEAPPTDALSGQAAQAAPPAEAPEQVAELPLPPPPVPTPPSREAARQADALEQAARPSPSPWGPGPRPAILGASRATGTVSPPGPLDGYRNPSPEYPRASRERGEEGVVRLLLHVSAAGFVTAVEVAQSSGHDALDQAARRAVARWRFRPALRDGRPVDGTIRTAIHFRLTQ